MKRFIPFSLIIFLSIVGCQTVNLTENSPTLLAVSATAPLATITSIPAANTNTPTTIPTLTPEPTYSFHISSEQLTQIVGISPACVEINHDIVLPETSYSQFPGTLLAFLNQGGDPFSISSKLNKFFPIDKNLVPVWIADLTINGKQDILISLQDPQSQSIPSSGIFLIYICENNQYSIENIILPETPEGVAKIVHVQDLDNNFLPEIITSNSFCGAHTCFEQINILSWNGDQFANKLIGSTASLPFPSLQITDYDHDNIYDLEITSNGFGSAGAGPQRSITQYWRLNVPSGAWEKSSESVGASNYRIHVLFDADGSLNRGEYDVAIVLYERVITDDLLSDWVDAENEKKFLHTYAQYKQIVVYAVTGDFDKANQVLSYIESEVVPGDRREVILRLAQQFLAEAITNSVENGCAVAISYTNQHLEELLSPLGPTTYGYAQPEYPVNEVCPFSN